MYKIYSRNTAEFADQSKCVLLSLPSFKPSRNLLIVGLDHEKNTRKMSTLDALALASEMKINEGKLGSKASSPVDMVVRVKPVSVNTANMTQYPVNAIQRSYSEVVVRRDRSQDHFAIAFPKKASPVLTPRPTATELSATDREFMRKKFMDMYRSQAGSYEELLELCVAQQEEALFRANAACKLEYFKQGFRSERLIREVVSTPVKSESKADGQADGELKRKAVEPDEVVAESKRTKS